MLGVEGLVGEECLMLSNAPLRSRRKRMLLWRETSLDKNNGWGWMEVAR